MSLRIQVVSAINERCFRFFLKLLNNKSDRISFANGRTFVRNYYRLLCRWTLYILCCQSSCIRALGKPWRTLFNLCRQILWLSSFHFSASCWWNLLQHSCSQDFANPVTVTDLFPFANQCPHQAIRLYTDTTNQRQNVLIPFFPLELFFLVLFGSRPVVREHLVSSQDRLLSRPLLRTFHMERILWRTRCY